MTKADIISNICDSTGLDKIDVQITVEKFMEQVKKSIEAGNNVI